MSTDTELPEGWATATLGDLCHHPQYGWTTSATREGPGVRLLRTTDISSGQPDWYAVPFCTESPEEVSKYLLGAGDIVVSRAGSVGISCLINHCPKAVFASYLIRLRTRDPILPAFVHLFLQSSDYWSQVSEHQAGIAVQNLNATKLTGLELPLPPVAEQRRIVAAVEAVLAKVRAARERLNRVPAILKRFRQSVLSAACSGRLTADWRAQNPNAETGSQFVARVASEPSTDSDTTDTNDDLPETWTRATFGRITANFDGQRKPVKSDDRAKRRGAYPYYGASGIIDSIDAYLFDGEYLLIGEDGANLLSRSTPIAFQAAGQFWVNNHAHIVQTLGEMPLAYLELFVNGFDLQEFVTGSAQPKLTQAALNRIPVPVPPLAEQREIVARVSALFARADAIDARLTAARTAADRLTQAVLAKAFRGELVPTEAELARRENRTYEPASELLARVRAGTEQPAAPKPARKRKPKPNAT